MRCGGRSRSATRPASRLVERERRLPVHPVEDIAEDLTTPNVVYIADTGEPRAAPGQGAAYMTRQAATFRGAYMNGRLFKLVLNPSDPTRATLSIAHDADAGGFGNPNAIHQLDNLESTARSVLIQEDPGGHNQGISYARIWRYDIATGTTEVVARVNQDQAPSAAPGACERAASSMSPTCSERTCSSPTSRPAR